MTPSSDPGGVGGVLFLRYLLPKRRHKGEAPGEMRSPRWNPHQGRDWVRVREHFLQHAVPSRSGQVIQMLVGAWESFAVGTAGSTSWRASTQKEMKQQPANAPQQAQVPTGGPGEGAGVTGQLSHNRLVAGRTTYLDWAGELRKETGCSVQTICTAVALALGMDTGWA